MYTKKNNFKILSCIIIYLSTLIFLSILTTSAQSKIFKIEDIEISEPFDDNFNKEKVINTAFFVAFKELTSTIIVTKDKPKIKYSKLNEIKYLVESFEIKNERFLDKKYIAKINVNFNKKRTLNFFEKKNIFPSLKKKRDFLTILILIDNDKNQIFLFENNPFYKNWNNKIKKFFLINYILIDEDIEDFKTINDNKDNIENFQFDKIIKKYDLDDYIISIIFKNKKELRVLSKFFFDKNLKIINKKYRDINLNDQDELDTLILETKTNFEDLWKSKNLINTSLKLPINLQLNPKDNLKIVKLEQEMDEIDLIYDYYITKISSLNLNYKVIFNGSPKQFLKIMREKNIIIDTENGIWKIK
tara:strand:- start:188 stop:1264 length:1077 start_codon:yes stop_codon:yes gene_type:complete